MTIASNLAAIRDRIAQAAQRAGRNPDEIALMAVSKTQASASIIEAYHAGQRLFGENRVQEFADKFPQLADLKDAEFHMIGHLQSNKTAKAAELFQVVQTVDSAKLARRLNDAGPALDVMLEVKLSPEESKHGVDPGGVPALIASVRACPNLRLRGLMTMPPWSEDPEAPRAYFRTLRQLAEAHGLAELSMGMSNDLETAIEEGSTCVRVGTALFGKRRKV